MSKTAKIGDRIKVLKVELGNKSDRELEMGGLPGGKWLISNGLLSKWENESVEYTTNKLEEFLNHYNVNRQWWKTGEGEVLNKNGTSVQIEPAVTGKQGRVPEDIYRDLVEANSEYRLVPKVILEGKYVMVLENQIGKTEEALWETIRAKNDLIKDLKDEIAMYRASRRASTQKGK